MKATVITDASYCPETGAAGWAAWLAFDDGRRMKCFAAFKTYIKNSTVAEIRAACNGLHIAFGKGATNILLQTDNLRTVELALSGGLPIKIPEGVTIHARHVKGHTTRTEPRFFVNRWCDRMAKKCMKKKRSILRSNK